jgi:cbb3-type cytochrome oxidase subunit 3
MGWFIFIGDMLVMFFMVLLVVWVSTSASKATLDYSANIPLLDDKPVSADAELLKGEKLDG